MVGIQRNTSKVAITPLHKQVKMYAGPLSAYDSVPRHYTLLNGKVCLVVRQWIISLIWHAAQVFAHLGVTL
jgi:hypothetical protein